MPSLSMLRLVRCSPMLYTTNSNSMMFSLPSLSPKETAYAQLQLATVKAHSDSCEASSLDELSSRVKGLSVNFKTKKIVSSHLLMERCLAICSSLQPSHVVQNSSTQPGHLLAAKTPITTGASRSFHTTPHLRDREEGLKTRKVKILHIQNPLTWLKTFLKFREIKLHWDPHLDQENFIEGAKYAVEAITSKLEQGEWKELRGLLSRKEFKRLCKEVETEWSDVMRQNVSLEVEQMVKVLITDIRTHQIVENKFCDIDVMVMGLKEQERKTPLVMQMEVRLHREYTEGCLPDWVVTRFRMKNWDKSGHAGNI